MNIEDRLKQMLDSARADRDATDAEWREFSSRAHRTVILRRAAAGVGAASMILVALVGFRIWSGQSDHQNVPQPVGSPVETPTPSDEPPPIPDGTGELWQVMDGELWVSRTFVNPQRLKARVAPANDVAARLAAYWLNALIEQPSYIRKDLGARTAIPQGTRLTGISRTGVNLTVELETNFSTPESTPASLDLAMGQIVYTATSIDGINSVNFRMIVGADKELTGTRFFRAADGGEFFTRSDFRNIAPSIVMEAPKTGVEISHEVDVHGFVNIEEKSFTVEVRDQNNDLIAELELTDGCRCWQDFSASLEFEGEIERRQEGYVSVTTTSEDGGEREGPSVPVILVPSPED